MKNTDTYQTRTAACYLAMRQAGCHYLWGGAGATPGGQDGMPRRPNSVKLVPNRLESRSPSLWAASCSVDGTHVCAGRYKSLSGGRVASPLDQDLKDYLASLQGLDPDSWPPFYEIYWPRVMSGKTVTTQIVWGEDCRGVRHFDCVGLVNWTLATILHRASVQDSIAGWVRQTTAVTGGDWQPFDILTQGHHHIGILTHEYKVIQAAQASLGVVYTGYSSSDWRRGRLPDEYFVYDYEPINPGDVSPQFGGD